MILLDIFFCQIALPVVPCVERGVTGVAPVASGKLLGVTVDVQVRERTLPSAVHFQHLIIPENMNDFKIPLEIHDFDQLNWSNISYQMHCILLIRNLIKQTHRFLLITIKLSKKNVPPFPLCVAVGVVGFSVQICQLPVTGSAQTSSQPQSDVPHSLETPSKYIQILEKICRS